MIHWGHLERDESHNCKAAMGIYRELFGPSKEDIWRQLSAEIGGKFVDSGFWHDAKVEARVQNWTVTLDTCAESGHSRHPHTRLRAPFVNADGFRFQIYRAGIFSDLGKHLGMQDVEVGIADFDREFVIKGTNEALLRQLFQNEKIRNLLRAQPNVHFEVAADEGWFGADFPEGVDELRFKALGDIRDLDRLKQLFELFAVTLDQLCAMGSAYDSVPEVKETGPKPSE